jgi:hypothetical protein
MKRIRLLLVPLGLGLLVASSMATVADATFGGSLWSFPVSAGGQMTVAPNGTVLDGEDCVELNPGGTELWSLTTTLGFAQGCWDSVADSAGNTYVLDENAKHELAIQSVDPIGNMRWGTTTGGRGPWRTTPVLGANGDVYFSVSGGKGTSVIGVDEQTGALTLEKSFDDVTGLYAYVNGLVVVDGPRQVDYLNYDGTVIHEYSTGSAISASTAYANAGGADGTVFLVGYEGSCSATSHASVEKLTPGGLAWTWTDPAQYCEGPLLAATPDGGVVFGRYPSIDFTSIDLGGKKRWSHEVTGPTGGVELGAGSPTLPVDVNGIVVLFSRVYYPCELGPSKECRGSQVDYLSETTGQPVLPQQLITASSEGGFIPLSGAIDSGRTYIGAAVDEQDVETERSIFAFPTPGLGKSYEIALQEAVTASGPPSPPPSPPPTLPVTIANGGGGGVAGAPDPPNFENGNCDPGDDTNWLHIVRVTFTCIVSEDVWSDPTLISAKNRCIINLGVDFLPFIKALKLPKYVKETGSVEATLRLLGQRLTAASYPGKVSGDAQAVSDIQTSLRAIKDPNQAILTVISSRRVLGGLITKLGKGGAAAAKLAHEVAVVETAVTNLVETVSGIQDIKDCITAFGGP